MKKIAAKASFAPSLDWIVLSTGILMLSVALIGTILGVTQANAEVETAQIIFDATQPI